ncbi:Os08g0413400 [Oryza sativa Japonica Group]|uniref:Uncharacterized protein n=2 Tax=Oryza sativa subsp. japonica TaxID=39947 RepID=A0A8J8YHN5_ORYSJ|nr:hypothetical protein OsJ_27301 [Oryza sativa Japonica Group]BAT05420.1 Os08g0413400 [Oryza sativa Japonica Group]
MTYGRRRRRSKDDVSSRSASSGSSEVSSIRMPVRTSNRGALLATSFVVSASSYTSTTASPPLYATATHTYSALTRWSLAARQRPYIGSSTTRSANDAAADVLAYISVRDGRVRVCHESSSCSACCGPRWLTASGSPDEGQRRRCGPRWLSG